VLLASEVVGEGVYAVVAALAGFAVLGEGGLGGRGGGVGFGGEDLLSEDFRGYRGKGCYAALEIISTRRILLDKQRRTE
jgi:hypothetical protein